MQNIRLFVWVFYSRYILGHYIYFFLYRIFLGYFIDLTIYFIQVLCLFVRLSVSLSVFNL